MTITEEIRSRFKEQQDIGYRELQIRTTPSVEASRIVGVRTPALRSLAKELGKREDVGEFLKILPHELFEEDQLHAFIISGYKDYGRAIDELERFLPYVDNWATCDQMSPKVFKKHRPELMEHIKKWIKSDKTYTVRFGVGMLMEHFLDEDFDVRYAEMVAELRSDEYYVNMMIAWYFATALAKQYDEILPFIREERLDVWTHNKTIQKAIESYRITPEQKEYLKTLKIKKSR
ncbi:MAG: DNA alkylation repair protein [Clostridiales bacterium]|nr:DNA alkylation repair protein [Clostridiales bacterium]